MGITFSLERPSIVDRSLLERPCGACGGVPTGAPAPEASCGACGGYGGSREHEEVYWRRREIRDGCVDTGGARAAEAFRWLGVEPAPIGELDGAAALAALRERRPSEVVREGRDPLLIDLRVRLTRLAEKAVEEGVRIVWG